MTNTIDLLHGNRLKTGDKKPILRAQLFQDGEPYNLSAVDAQNGTVTLKLRRSDSDTTEISEPMDIDEPANRGLVAYDWQGGDTDVSGTYLLEIIVDDGGDAESFPSTGFGRLYITDSI